VPVAWPIEEVWLRPLATLVLAAALPFATARVLAALTLPHRLPDDASEVARALAPFRTAATIVGFVQVQLAWMIGATALGPMLVDHPEALPSTVFAAATAIVTFVAGGPARAIERAGERRATLGDPSPARAQILLRLRLLPWLGGPVVVALIASSLPVVREGHLDPLVTSLAFVLTLVGVAFAGPLLSVLTLALRPASGAIRERAERAARREGVSLLAVLRLPTHGVRLANAAALPWARTMIVTDHIVQMLDERALDAVLAHEAGHLSEPPWVAVARLGTVATLLFAGSSGVVIADALWPDSSPWVLVGVLVLALVLLRSVLRLARRMEERADDHARRAVSADALADALLALARDAQAPLVTGRGPARMHPDLFDRVCACGRDIGPRPMPPPRRPGWIAAFVVSAGLLALPLLAEAATRIETDSEAETGTTAATWRLRVDPWDAHAMLSMAWAAALDGNPDLARARLAMARRLGARESDAIELDAELLARAGRCDEARARFDDALRARASDAFAGGGWAPLPLGGYHLPPSLVECGLGD
jgi:Zn-dependent protease with chaperone function